MIQSTREPDLNGFPPELLSTKQDISLSLGYGLTTECDLQENRVMMRATFDDNLLNRVQIQRIFLQFEYLLHQLCSKDPAARVSDVQKIAKRILKRGIPLFLKAQTHVCMKLSNNVLRVSQIVRRSALGMES